MTAAPTVAHRPSGLDLASELRTGVARAIGHGIAALRRSRRRDPERRLAVRFLRQLPRSTRSTSHIRVAEGGPPAVRRAA